MIIFDLKCAPQGHVFEAWFGSSDDYEAQSARGLVACPICGAGEVGEGADGARASAAKGNQTPTRRRPEAMKAMLAEMARSAEEAAREERLRRRPFRRRGARHPSRRGRGARDPRPRQPRRAREPDRGWNPGRAAAVSGARAGRGELTGRPACVTARARHGPVAQQDRATIPNQWATGSNPVGVTSLRPPGFGWQASHDRRCRLNDGASKAIIAGSGTERPMRPR